MSASTMSREWHLLAGLRVRASQLGLICFGTEDKGDWVRKAGPSGAVYWQRGKEKRYQPNKPGVKRVAAAKPAGAAPAKSAASKPPIKPEAKKPAEPKPAKEKAPKKPAAPKADPAAARAVVERGMQGQASVAEMATALAGLSQPDINALKKAWGQKVGGKKVEQALKLAQWALSKAGAAKPPAAPASASVPAAPAPAAPKPPPATPAGMAFPPPGMVKKPDPAVAKQLAAHFKARKLSPAQTKALEEYTESEPKGGVATFSAVNKAARGDIQGIRTMARIFHLDPEAYLKKCENAMDDIDEAMRGARLPAPALVHRGIMLKTPQEAEAFVAKLQQAAERGDPVTMDGGFQSTSLDPKIARSFGGWAGAAQQVRMEIMASRGLYVDGISRNAGESELLLPRDAQYRVHKVDHIDEHGQKVRVIQLEQIS